MTLLACSILALLVGPFIYSAVRQRNVMISMMDGFIFVAITGMVLLYILPESFELGGWFTLIFVLAGLFGPTLLESLSRRSAEQTHIVALVLGLSGLALHATLDGAALSQHFPEGDAAADLIPLAIILHRLPVGLTIWWLLRPNFGKRVSTAVLGLVAVSTTIGYHFGFTLTEGLSGQGIAWFQALVAGSLLHVVFHQPHIGQAKCGCKQEARQNNRWEGLGALLGVLLLIALVGHAGDAHHSHSIDKSFSTFWTMVRESAPALVLAYIMAGLMSAFLPKSSIQWMRKGSASVQSLRGMLVGLPFPICSCGVVPLYQTLIRRGAPATAGMAFLIATPELGVDAVLLSIPLLGVEFTLVRIAAAAVVAFLVGRWVGSMRELRDFPVEAEGSGQPAVAQGESGFLSKLLKAVKDGLGEVVDHTGPWIVLGLCIAAAAEPILDSGWLARIPAELQIPLFAALGLPVYVCASGATPLVAVLVYNGISPGAALAFLLTGPATNVTTFGLLGKLHSKRVAAIFSLVTVALAVGLGYLVDMLLPNLATPNLHDVAAEETTTLQVISVTFLALLYLSSVLRRGARKFVAELFFNSQMALDIHPHYPQARPQKEV